MGGLRDKARPYICGGVSYGTGWPPWHLERRWPHWKLYVSILSATNLPDPKNPYVKLNVSSQPSPQERSDK